MATYQESFPIIKGSNELSPNKSICLSNSSCNSLDSSKKDCKSLFISSIAELTFSY
jgi:hypothetical protein